MLAQVEQLDPRQFCVLDDARGRIRHKDLTAASGVADACSAVHTDPDITVLIEMGLGGVEADTHADYRVCRPCERGKRELYVNRGCNGASGTAEGDEEAIACRIDLPSAVRFEYVAQEPAVVGADSGKGLVADTPHEVSRLLDVAEEEGHSAPRQGRGAHIVILPFRPVDYEIMNLVQSVLEAIGNTPLVRVRRCAPPNGAELWLKLEYRNPTGSLKDRMALAMIEGAERDRLISAGDTVVEYTGGSTGPALAFVCRAKGYRALIVIADCFTEERFQLMRALGAELDVIPSVEGPPKVTAQDIRNIVARAEELAARPGHYATDQFNNPYIIPDHRDRLGREIWEQSDGHVTAFCHGMGTASSLMGVSDALKPHGVFIQGHEPASSAVLSGGEPGPFLIQGWTGFVMPHWDPGRVDHVEPIGDDESLEMTRRLASEEGIFAGISTGANVVGAHRLAERLGPEAVIVTLAVDTGFKYMSVSPYADA
jgi:cysteine synthase A